MPDTKLTWAAPTKYAQVTTGDQDGWYSICKIHCGQTTTYEAFRRRAHPDGAGMIAVGMATAEAARSRVEAHHALLSHEPPRGRGRPRKSPVEPEKQP